MWNLPKRGWDRYFHRYGKALVGPEFREAWYLDELDCLIRLSFVSVVSRNIATQAYDIPSVYVTKQIFTRVGAF